MSVNQNIDINDGDILEDGTLHIIDRLLMSDNVRDVLREPKYKVFLSIIKGLRNGIVYGMKVRFPHALVMTFLFRRTNFKDMMRKVLRATYEHSKNLGSFVFVFKSVTYLLENIMANNKNNGIINVANIKDKSYHTFIAGCIGGYLIFGKSTPVNRQIVLYLLSRIIVGSSKLFVKTMKKQAPEYTFPVAASLIWGIVMWLFHYDKDVLQLSLRKSMDYLYIKSNTWDSLKNFLWHNE